MKRFSAGSAAKTMTQVINSSSTTARISLCMGIPPCE
jgi:hypothetical protein